MSLHTICDKCMKVIDGSEPWVQIAQTTLVNNGGIATVETPSATYDYHPNHAPKLVKGQPEPPPEINNELPEPEDA